MRVGSSAKRPKLDSPLRVAVGSLFIVTLFAIAAQSRGASTVRGTVILNQFGGRPLANVQIADSVEGGGSCESGSDGEFALELPNRSPGQRIRITAKKEGLVVVNQAQLQLTLTDNPDNYPIEIIMSRGVDREEMLRRLYIIRSSNAIEKSYRSQLPVPPPPFDPLGSKLDRKRLLAKWASESVWEVLIREHTGNDIELYQEAERLFLERKTDEAITLLDDEKLDEEEKKSIENSIQARLLKAQLLTLQIRFEDAEKCYRDAIRIAPDSFDANYAFGKFSTEVFEVLNGLKDARSAYEHCVELAKMNRNNADLAAVLDATGKLGIVQSGSHGLKDARKAYEESLTIRRELAAKNSEAYLPDVAATLNDLGELELIERRKECKADYEEALKIYRNLAQHRPETFLPDVVTTLDNFAAVAAIEGQNEVNRQKMAEKLQTYRELAKINRSTYLPHLATTLDFLFMFDRKILNWPEEALKDGEEEVKVYRELAVKDPETYLPDVARSLIALAWLNKDQDQFEDARRQSGDALKIYESLGNEQKFSNEIDDAKELLRELSN
jgi:tetratricopeptide (TPR) repeat protein